MKTALITGASRGIGAETACELARRGYALVLAARSEKNLKELETGLSRYKTPVLVVPTDVRNRDQLHQLAHKSLERFGAIDVLLHNAGILHPGLVSQVTSEQITAVIETNLTAPIELTRTLLPSMIQRGQGHIGFVSSVAGLVGIPTIAVYTATKFALRGFARALRRELGSTGIKVSVVSPGVVDTDIIAPVRGFLRGLPLKIKRPDEVAVAIAETVTRGRREIVFPKHLKLLVWLESNFPKLLDWYSGTHIQKLMRSGVLKGYDQPAPIIPPPRVAILPVADSRQQQQRAGSQRCS
jgi:short-subunit dehydrogenase